ncbi:hypothetical protein CLOP_g10516 [Closterium sp. NIES-67]|nr:hypothetical protein CLOP_g10516 [Closterium sp. NIES-67]
MHGCRYRYRLAQAAGADITSVAALTWAQLDSVDWREYFSPSRTHARPLRRIPPRVRGGISDVLRAITALCLQLRDQMARVFLASQQFGVGVTCGTEVTVRGVVRALADHPGWVVLQLDVANAFNSFFRDVLFQALHASPEFREASRHIEAHALESVRARHTDPLHLARLTSLQGPVETFGCLSEPLRQFLGLCASRTARRRRDSGAGDDGSARIFETSLTTRLSVALQRAQANVIMQHAVRQLGGSDNGWMPAPVPLGAGQGSWHHITGCFESAADMQYMYDAYV